MAVPLSYAVWNVELLLVARLKPKGGRKADSAEVDRAADNFMSTLSANFGVVFTTHLDVVDSEESAGWIGKSTKKFLATRRKSGESVLFGQF